MYAGVRTNNLRSMVGFTLRANPLVQQVRRMIDGGEIAEILNLHAERYNSSMLQGSPKRNWKTDPGSTSAGVVADLGSHAIDLVQFWAGPITRVAASLETHVKEGIDDSGETFPLELDDEANLLVKFASGANGTVLTSRIGLIDSHKPLGRSNFTIGGTKFAFVTDGVMEAQRHRPGHDPEVVDPNLPLEEADHAGVLAFFGERMMRNFVASIKEGARYRTDAGRRTAHSGGHPTPPSRPPNAASGSTFRKSNRPEHRSRLDLSRAFARIRL